MNIPDWLEPREDQQDALEEIEDLFDEGKRVVFLDAPTGSGKSIIGFLAAEMQGENSRALYVCTTKGLQDQFLADFPDARVLKGRANYLTLDDPAKTADDCDLKGGGVCDSCVGTGFDDEPTTKHCSHCHPYYNCPYRVSKERAIKSDLSVVNTAYFLPIYNFTDGLGPRDIIIIDEADELENSLMGFIEVRFTSWERERYNLGRPKFVTKDESWIPWVAQTINTLKRSLSRLDKGSKPYRKLDNKIESAKKMLDSMREGHPWVLDEYERKGDKLKNLTFRPVRVDMFRDLLWEHADRFLLMSASTISAQVRAESMGLESHEWGEVLMESNFEPAHRPLFVGRTAGKVTFRNKDDSYPKLAALCDEICESEGGRVLIHTNSYALANYLHDNMTYPSMTYGIGGRDQAMSDWLLETRMALCAPSMERGFDLKDDMCRTQIIAKVPYPSLRDKQVEARMHSPGGQDWYSMQTVAKTIQASGRIVRSETDFGATHIIDASFNEILKRNSSMFPQWWKSALVPIGGSRSRTMNRDYNNRKAEHGK